MARICHTNKTARIGGGLAKASLRRRFTALRSIGSISSLYVARRFPVAQLWVYAGLKIDGRTRLLVARALELTKPAPRSHLACSSPSPRRRPQLG